MSLNETFDPPRKCVLCREERASGFAPPCCGESRQTFACSECIEAYGDRALIVWAESGVPECVTCRETAVADDYIDVLPDHVARIRQAVERGAGDGAGGDDDADAEPDVVDPGQNTWAAWTSGSVIHSCGRSISIIEGCDVTRCPDCRGLVNVAGGEGGAHTFHMQEFFTAVRAFTATTSADQVQSLAAQHPVAWGALQMNGLLEAMMAGDPDGVLDAMDPEAWGAFGAFLSAAYLPKDEADAVPTTSLRAIYDVLVERSDGAAAATAVYTWWGAEPPAEMEFQESRRRMNLLNDASMPTDVSEILRSNLRADASWWASE